ncbi:hypothetical protein [Longimicrobium sp.]|uniref:hypothetical protein n=1 Tax=Longimicrobium sp. TaxID=2029185 RepID=UPI002E302D38|nr:hypothetical protein [Longimicrobium sp.]HEX6038952.1 hypothetical protein [Longimicrobium sp.]
MNESKEPGTSVAVTGAASAALTTLGARRWLPTADELAQLAEAVMEIRSQEEKEGHYHGIEFGHDPMEEEASGNGYFATLYRRGNDPIHGEGAVAAHAVQSLYEQWVVGRWAAGTPPRARTPWSAGPGKPALSAETGEVLAQALVLLGDQLKRVRGILDRLSGTEDLRAAAGEVGAELESLRTLLLQQAPYPSAAEDPAGG